MIQEHDHDDKYRLEPESNELSKKKELFHFQTKPRDIFNMI